MTHLAGELAGLATAFLWSLSALAWSSAGRRIGAVAVTNLRLALATLLLMGGHRLLLGTFWPVHLGAGPLALLAASGVLGAGLGDLCYFSGLVLIGPRLGMLILSIAPVLSALLAYFTPMHETLGPAAIAGIACTVGGVAWVVSKKPGKEAGPARPEGFRAGVLWVLTGTLFIAGGYVLSKVGMAAVPGKGADPFSASLVRVAAATLFSWAGLPLLRQTRSTLRAVREGRVMLTIAAGTLVGPVIGIWLSMVAIKLSPTGAATALIGTSPIMMIPIAALVYGEKPSARTLFGTLLAVGGVALLMLQKMLG